jgi:hypothetical protein
MTSFPAYIYPEELHMTLDIPTIVTVCIVLLFYLRIIALQWGKAKTAHVSAAGKVGSQTGPRFRITSWYIVGIGAFLILLSAAVLLVPGMNQTLRGLWWIPLNLGIFLFMFSFR